MVKLYHCRMNYKQQPKGVSGLPHQGEDEMTFYMVWGEGKSAPTIKHATHEMALAEAKRLAGKHGDKVFYVLKAISECSVINVVPILYVVPTLEAE